MTGAPWYKRYPLDFIDGTIGMSLELKGAYCIVIDLIYARGGEIPDDDRWLAGVCGVSVRKWKSLRAALIEAGKIVVENGMITNFRARKELETFAKLSRKRAESGRRGGRKRAENDAESRKNNDLRKQVLEQKPSIRARKDTDKDTDKEQVLSGESTCSAPARAGPGRADDRKGGMGASPPGCRFEDSPFGGVVPADWRAWAEERGLPPPVAKREAEKFARYWRAASGQRALKADWRAAWEYWIIRELEEMGDEQQGEGGVDGRTDAIASLVDNVAAAEGGGGAGETADTDYHAARAQHLAR